MSSQLFQQFKGFFNPEDNMYCYILRIIENISYFLVCGHISESIAAITSFVVPNKPTHKGIFGKHSIFLNSAVSYLFGSMILYNSGL